MPLLLLAPCCRVCVYVDREAAESCVYASYMHDARPSRTLADFQQHLAVSGALEWAQVWGCRAAGHHAIRWRRYDGMNSTHPAYTFQCAMCVHIRSPTAAET